MNETIIKEIANQLGMAVDQAGLFIADHLPEYAQLKAMQLSVPVAVFAVIFAICLIVAIISLIIAAHLRKKCMKEDTSKNKYFTRDWRHYMSFDVFILALILSVMSLVILILVCLCFVPEIIGWLDYPESMLIDFALKAI